jgi:predicted DNA-binding transcriptional regulator AlpA
MLKTRNGDIIGSLSDERLIRMKELQGLVGLARSTIHRLVAQGRFPEPIHPLGNHIATWRYSEVSTWIADRCDGKVA